MPSAGVHPNPDIRPIGPFTEAEVPKLREALSRLSVNQAARELGLSTNQVVNAKRKYGLTSKPHELAKSQATASAAYAAVARQTRHARRDKWQRLYDLAAAELEHDLEPDNPATTILKGAMGIEAEAQVSKVPARDIRDRFAALNIAEVQLQKLDALDDDQGLARGMSVIERFNTAAEALVGNLLPAPRDGLIQE